MESPLPESPFFHLDYCFIAVVMLMLCYVDVQMNNT